MSKPGHARCPRDSRCAAPSPRPATPTTTRRRARLQRDDRPPPGADRALRRRGRRDRRGRASRASTSAAARDPRRRPQRRRPGQRRRRPGDRPLRRCAVCASTRPRASARVRGGSLLGDVDHATHAVRPGAAERDHLHHRRRRPHARRRARPPHARLRPDDRQPARGRRRARRRPARARASATRTRPVLGAARRRRQLRRRRRRSRSALHPVGDGARRPDAVAARARRRGHARLSTTSSRDGAGRSSTASSCSSRCRRGRRSRRSCTGRRCAASSGAYTDPEADGRLRRPARAPRQPALHGVGRMPFPALELVLRRALPARAPVVLARGLRQRADRRGDRAHVRARPRKLPTMQSTHAPVPDRRRGRARRQGRHRVGLPRRAVRAGHRRRRPRPGERGRAARLDASATTRRCTRTRWAAPT